jgi:O-6-methylguanine DNA methyltransferase
VTLTRGLVESAAGPLLVQWSDIGVQSVALVVYLPPGESADAPPAPAEIGAAVLAGQGERAVLTELRPFQRAVLEVTCAIPRGEVRTYGWLADELGSPGAVRAVGTALKRNPLPVLVPCHRVTRAGLLTGRYALGDERKRQLLAAEGLDLAELDRLAASGHRIVAFGRSGIQCAPRCPRCAADRPLAAS